MRMPSDNGFTLIELVIVAAIIAVIAVVALPGFRRARISANEASAIGSLRAVNGAELAYSTSAARGGYAIALTTLGLACPGGRPFLSAELAGATTVVRSGYRFTLVDGAGAANGPIDCNGRQSRTAYYATATSAAWGSTGTRAFGTTANGEIWENTAANAPPTEAQMQAPPTATRHPIQ